ncbi:unnamed protein product [Spodoptera exigua]|nr:unnamed protein product [Spodoptera exigua]
MRHRGLGLEKEKQRGVFLVKYEDIYSSDNESANSDLYQDDAFGQDVFKNKTSDINKRIQMTLVRFMTEVEAGDAADMLGQNKHVEQSNVYLDLGRRFVPQYKYTDTYKEPAAEHNDELIPEKAPPELVLLIAKESALMGPDKQSDLKDFDEKRILRSGPSGSSPPDITPVWSKVFSHPSKLVTTT